MMTNRLHIAFIALAAMAASAQAADVNVIDFGAKGDGIADDAAAIQQAIDRCSATGGGTVTFPSGHTFMSGPLHLRSNIDLYMAPNATLLANPDESIYKESAFRGNEGEGMMWISGDSLKNVSISGTGRIDGNAVAFMGAELDDSFELKPVSTFDPRPHVLTLTGCEGVRINDVTVANSAYWTIHLVGCHDVVVKGISLLNNLKVRNGDGIDIDHSHKVRISDCYIESGDDCICLKNRREFEEYGPCYDITVSNCIMTSRSCAVKIGSENMDRISDVVFDNCIIRDSNRGIGIQNRDEGTVENVVFSNIILDCHLFSEVWWGQSEPIYITSYPRAIGNHKDAGWRFPKGATKGACGEVKDIRFINIFAKSENGIFIGCDTPGKIRDILLDNVRIDLVDVTPFEKGVYDRRPCDGEGWLRGKSYGIYNENALDVRVRDLDVRLISFPKEKYGGDSFN